MECFELFDNYDDYAETITRVLANPGEKLAAIPVFSGKNDNWYGLLKQYNLPVKKAKPRAKSRKESAFDLEFYKESVRKYNGYLKKQGKKMESKTDFIVLLGQEPRYIIPAILFSLCKERKLILLEDFSQLPAWTRETRPTSVTLIFPPHLLDQTGYEIVVDMISGRPEGSDTVVPLLGCFTGRNISSLTWLIGKNLFAWDRFTASLVLLPELESADSTTLFNGTFEILTHQDCTKADIFNKTNGDKIYKMLIAQGHGRVDGGMIGEGMICGQKNDTSNLGLTYPGNGPQCAYGCGCYMDGPILKGVDIPAVFSVLSICSSGQLHDTIYDQDFLLGLSTIDGISSAFIGNIRTFYNEGWEVTFLIQACRAGLPMGEVIRLLNLLQVKLNGDCPSFILVGDPLAQVYKNPGKEAPAERKIGEKDETYRLETGGQPFVIAPLNRPRTEETPPGNLLVKPVNNSAAPDINGMVLELNHTDYVLAWCFPADLPENFEFKLISEPCLTEMQKRQWQALQRNYALNRFNDLLPPTVDDKMEEINFLAKDIGSRLSLTRYNYQVYHQLKQEIVKLEKAVDQVNEQLMRDLIGTDSRPWPFEYLIYNNYRQNNFSKTGMKCWCRRPLKKIKLVPNMGIGEERDVYSCIRCSEVRIQPEDGFQVSWQGEDSGVVNRTVTHRFILSHHFDRTIRGCLGLHFGRHYGGKVQFAPEIQPFEIEPGSQQQFDFTMTLGELKPHAFLITAYIVYELQIELFSKYLHVLPG